MKRVLLGVTMLGASAFLAGCPIYSNSTDDNVAYGDYEVCNGTTCFDCPDQTITSECVAWTCNTGGPSYPPNGPDGCPDGYSCSSTDVCVAVDAGAGCGTGCPTGYVCGLSAGIVRCISLNAADATADEGGTDGPELEPTVDASVTVDGSWALDASPPPLDAELPQDATPATDVSASDAALDGGGGAEGGKSLGGLCNADSECASTGAKCVDGLCTGQSDLCSDGTQCLAGGEECVDGLCVPTCSVSSTCPAGYGCDYNRHVCIVNPGPCTTSAGCSGGAVCVDGHCAAPCPAADSGSSCFAGEVCVNGGCIPDQQAVIACSIEGTACTGSSGSGVCVRGGCYAACPDGGGCTGGDDVCKAVTGNKGSYQLCGTATNLGNDCNAAVGSYCAPGSYCIDGTCE
jgi:hypothetical protein